MVLAGGPVVSHVFSIAKEFVILSLSGDEPDPLTHLRLQKLLYYAQAWSLIVRESELFSDDLEAWRQGPVVPSVANKLQDGQGANTIRLEAFADTPDLQGEQAEFVRRVWESYNPHSACQHSRMAHEEQPWCKAWGNRGGDANGTVPIAIEDLENFFSQQEMPAPLVAHSNERRRREEEAERKLACLPPLEKDRLHAAATSVTPGSRKLASAG